MYFLKTLYILFIVLALNIFFFSTTNLVAKSFLIEEIEISEPLDMDFNKENLINQGFKIAFNELIGTLVKSKDLEKIEKTKLIIIKSMIESFSIKEEKFIKNIYHINLGVTFNKKKIYKYLEKRNIFPTQIKKETFLFVPIIIDQKNNEMILFSDNQFYINWNKENQKNYLIRYLLPTEDLEDINLIKSKSINIENYDFKKIIEKYFLDHSIVALIFKNNNETKILSKISIKDKKIIKNNSFSDFDYSNDDEINLLIGKLKIIYEDLWKDYNQINTSIRFPLLIKVNNRNLDVSSKFENILNEIDLIGKYSIHKFDRDYIYYEILFNGTPKNFLNIMKNRNYSFDTQKKIWVLNE